MTVTVDFTGICTHTPMAGGTHRIVLVRADNGSYINECAIPPHLPFLQIKPIYIKDIEGDLDGLQHVTPDTWRLYGVGLSLEGVTDTSLVYDDTFQKVPHLEMPDAPERRENMKVLMGEDAAGYFDFTTGTLSSSLIARGAHKASLVVNTDEFPKLKVRCFWNGSESAIVLQGDVHIELMHMGLHHGDTDKDFLLHYKIFEEIHSSAVVPPEKKLAVKGRGPNNISIGCSNSQYP